MIVVDTNIISYLYLTGEHSEQAEKLLRADPEWAAPLLWRSEFRNVLALYLQKRILSFESILSILDEAESLMGENEYEVSSLAVMDLVTKSTCSAYDCEFVTAAQDLRVPLITTDRNILEQFPDTAFSPDEYLRY